MPKLQVQRYQIEAEGLYRMGVTVAEGVTDRRLIQRGDLKLRIRPLGVHERVGDDPDEIADLPIL